MSKLAFFLGTAVVWVYILDWAPMADTFSVASYIMASACYFKLGEKPKDLKSANGQPGNSG